MLFSLHRGSARGKEEEKGGRGNDYVSTARVEGKEGAANHGIEFANRTRLFIPVKAEYLTFNSLSVSSWDLRMI